MRHLIAALSLALLPAALEAAETDAAALKAMHGADVVLLGEVHDNPGHHARQAEYVAALKPRALVMEMMSGNQAAIYAANSGAEAAKLADLLNWKQSGWPDFEMYLEILQAAGDVPVHGANVPRDMARAAMGEGIAAAFGDEAEAFGLTDPLPEAEQSEREAFQLKAHCDALPPEILPMMVDVQRLRDAVLARQALAAWGTPGDGPVVVITGNGHARVDRGVPVYLTRMRPGLRIVALGQSEDGQISGVFGFVADSPEVDRPDPCEAFAKGQ